MHSNHLTLPLSCRSKREVYNFLAVDVGVYLPAYEQVSIYFLKDIVGGKKNSKYLYLPKALVRVEAVP